MCKHCIPPNFFKFSYDREDLKSLLLFELFSSLSSVANVTGDAHTCGYIHLKHLYSLIRVAVKSLDS